MRMWQRHRKAITTKYLPEGLPESQSMPIINSKPHVCAQNISKASIILLDVYVATSYRAYNQKILSTSLSTLYLIMRIFSLSLYMLVKN